MEALFGVGYALEWLLENDPAVDHDRVVKEFDEISSRAIQADRDNPSVWLLRSRPGGRKTAD